MLKNNFCLCCGKPLELDHQSYWHTKCIKRFFGQSFLPEIDIDTIKNDLDEKAQKMLESGESVTGVQQKLSLGLSGDGKKLTVFDYPLGYILKPEGVGLTNYARAEHLVMSMANIAGIRTPEHGLLILKDNTYTYITKRFDRDNGRKIHVEDFCQLSNKPSEYKYVGSYEKGGKIISQYASKPNKDLSDYYALIIFNFISCNSDMHLKNFSLIEDEEIYFSPSYDLLPVNIVYPNDKDETALAVNGKNRNITRKDFIKLGINIGLLENACKKIISKILSYESLFINMIKDSLLEDEYKERFISELSNRIKRLS